MSKIVTDLNARERRRYALLAKDIARLSSELEDLLIAEDDDKSLINLCLLALAYRGLDDLVRIFQAATEIDVPDNPSGAGEPRTWNR